MLVSSSFDEYFNGNGYGLIGQRLDGCRPTFKTREALDDARIAKANILNNDDFELLSNFLMVRVRSDKLYICEIQQKLNDENRFKSFVYIAIH